jgi:hypothetical protein
MKIVDCGSNDSKKLTAEAGALPRLILASRLHRAEPWMNHLAAAHHSFHTLASSEQALGAFLEDLIEQNK